MSRNDSQTRTQDSGAPADELIIADFAAGYAGDFKRLNVEWITQHWELEDADRRVLDHPEEHIIRNGGAIFIALYDGNPVGTAALLAKDQATFELAKMAVSPTVQGKGFGYIIADHALEHARKMGAQRVYLESNTILTPAISLYRKLGFTELSESDEASPYSRCNIQMEKVL